MKWILVLLCVIGSAAGDTWSARGMAEGGEIKDFRLRGLARMLRYIITHRMVMAGVAANALSFIAFLALLSVAPLSFAVPATAIGYVFKTVLAKWYLHEEVEWFRWTGVALVSVGVYLLTL